MIFNLSGFSAFDQFETITKWNKSFCVCVCVSFHSHDEEEKYVGGFIKLKEKCQQKQFANFGFVFNQMILFELVSVGWWFSNQTNRHPTTWLFFSKLNFDVNFISYPKSSTIVVFSYKDIHFFVIWLQIVWFKNRLWFK